MSDVEQKLEDYVDRINDPTKQKVMAEAAAKLVDVAFQDDIAQRTAYYNETRDAQIDNEVQRMLDAIWNDTE